MADFDPINDAHGPGGEWSGYYEHDSHPQDGRRYPIHASLRVVGRRIEGVMSDEVTEFAYALGKILENARQKGFNPSPLFDRMIERHPDAIVRSTLPNASSLRGRIRGEALSFIKTYEGDQEIRYYARGQPLAAGVRSRHRVHYTGRFDPARAVIEGTWEIRRDPLGRFRRRLGTGTFSLVRIVI